MKPRVRRRTVDLSGYPNLVVIYLRMRVNALTGLKTLFGFGPRIAKSVEAHPDGLLLNQIGGLASPEFSQYCYRSLPLTLRLTDNLNNHPHPLAD